MIVCVCKNVSNKDIINYLDINGCIDFNSLITDLDCCNNCSVCEHEIKDIIQNKGFTLNDITC